MKARIVINVVAALMVWGAGNVASAGMATDVSRTTGGPPRLVGPPTAPVIGAIEQRDPLLTIAERKGSGLIQSAPVAFVPQPAPPDGAGGGGSPGDDVRTAQPLTGPAGHRSPLGSPPWMPLGLVLAFLATAAGLKRLS